jgi:hypothetical protein
MAMMLMSAVGVALVLGSSSELRIAANFQHAQEGLYAADAILERAMDDLASTANWNTVLAGTSRSGFVDGPPGGPRGVTGGPSLDLDETLSLVNCHKVVPCSPAELVATTAARPWGANNPVWCLYAYGPMASLLPGSLVNSSYYVVAMVADDPAENDDDPRRDGTSATSNPGAGVLLLRAEAFGPVGAHKVVEATVARVVVGALRVLSWREIR